MPDCAAAIDGYLLVTEGWLERWRHLSPEEEGAEATYLTLDHRERRDLSPSDLVPWKGVEREGGEREAAMGWEQWRHGREG